MSLGARIIIAIFAVLFGSIMVLHGTSADPNKAWFSYAFGAFCFFIAAACVLKGRAAAFCGSLVGSCVFLAALFYLVHAWQSEPLSSGGRSQPSILNALMFLVVFGIPGLLYAWRAKFGFGKVPEAQWLPPQDADTHQSTSRKS